MTAPELVDWTPTSPCGPSCLPERGALPQVAAWLRVWRLLAGAGMLALGGPLVAVTPVLSARVRRRWTRSWFLGVLRAFGVRIVTRDAGGWAGLDPGGRAAGTLVVSNHVSWLDVVALQALCPMRMLAKTEMRRWPVLGGLASRAGTLFIERGSLTGLRAAVDRIAGALAAGSVVGAFPEGTTWCGRSSGRHRPAVFQAALDGGARVQPVALRFLIADGRATTAAAFVGEATLLRSAARVARVRGLAVEVTVLPSLDAAGDRRELARRCSAAITSVTGSADIGWTSTRVEVAGSSGDHEERRDGRPGQQSRACRGGRRRPGERGTDERAAPRQRPVESPAA